MPDAINYDALDPGIREVVRAVNEWGWETVDSGNGVSKPQFEGCTLPFPHVFCESQWGPLGIINEAHSLAARLLGRFGHGWYVEATYSTKDGKALLVAMKETVGG